MIQRYWSSCFRSGDRSKRKGTKKTYTPLKDIDPTNSSRYENLIENPGEDQAYHIQTERAFKRRDEFKDSFSSSHDKLVKILKRYKDQNLDEYASKQAKTVMKKVYPILEKIFLKESTRKFYTAWLEFFYALTAKHSQFNDLFKDLWYESWTKSDRSREREEVHKFVGIVSRNNFFTQSLLQSKLECYEELVERMGEIYKEILRDDNKF